MVRLDPNTYTSPRQAVCVSIPLWFDWIRFCQGFVLRSPAVSIPLWFDWIRLHAPCILFLPPVSIPLWFDWISGPYPVATEVNPRFNPTMVRLDLLESYLFIRYHPACFNPTMVRLDPIRCFQIQPSFIRFNPTMVRLDQRQFLSNTR